MLSSDRLIFIQDLLSQGVIVRQNVKMWKGGINMARSGVDGDSEKKTPTGARYKVSYHRHYSLKEFKRTRSLSTFLSRFCRSNCYKSRYGLFIPSCNYEDYFAKINEIKTAAEEVMVSLIEERDRIKEDLRAQYVDAARTLWREQYGDDEPTINYINNAVEKYLMCFPSDNRIRAMFRFEVYPENPIIDKDSPVAPFIDCDAHNMRVYRSFYDSVIRRRESLKVICSGLYKEILERDEDSMNGMYKKVLLKIKRYIPSMFYDKELLERVTSLCDRMIVSDEGRTKQVTLTMLESIVESLNSNSLLRLTI